MGSYFSTGDAAAMNPWHYGNVAKRSAPKRDFMEVARNIVEHAIGEQMDGKPLPEPKPDKRNPHAVALGSEGGEKRWQEQKLCQQIRDVRLRERALRHGGITSNHVKHLFGKHRTPVSL